MRMLWLAGAMLVLAAPAGQAAPPQKAVPAKRAPAKVDWLATIATTPQGGVMMGNPDARVKLIEYGSRTCPHCARFDAEGLPALKSGYIATGQLSYEFRDFPIHGALDLGPILLGHCGVTRGFFLLLGAMMANQQALVGRSINIPAAKQQELMKAPPTVVAAYLANAYGYTDFVVSKGLPRARAAACLADRTAIGQIAQQAAFASKTFAVNGTPTFVVNGVAQPGVGDWATLEPVLQAAAAK